MVLEFPLATANFWAGLRIKQAQFYLPESLVMNTTGSGEVLIADMGTRLWQGSATLVAEYNADGAAIHAKLSAIRQPGRPFFAYDTSKQFPVSDPSGAVAASFPIIADISVNTRLIAIDNLPALYVLSAGDYLSFTYGTGPVRYALHQIVTGGMASSLGQATEIEVTPHIRPGALVGAAVTLIRPFCKCVYIPGSHSPASMERIFSTGMAFQFRQTLR